MYFYLFHAGLDDLTEWRHNEPQYEFYTRCDQGNILICAQTITYNCKSSYSITYAMCISDISNVISTPNYNIAHIKKKIIIHGYVGSHKWLECGTWYHHPRRLGCVLSRNLRIFKVATWHYRCRHNLKNNCIWDNLQCCLLVPRSPSKPVMLTFDLQSRKVLFIEIVFWHV